MRAKSLLEGKLKNEHNDEAEGYLIAVRLCMSDVVDSWNVGGQTIYGVFVAATGCSGELSDESLRLITIGTLDAYVLSRIY